MPLNLTPLLQRFAERAPLPVMARALLEHHFSATRLDTWFEQVATSQYTRELLFSTVFELMSQVVFRQHDSLRAAYQRALEPIGVSLSAVYDKLKGIEPTTTAALVSDSAARSVALIEQLGGQRQAWLPGVVVKVLDGNCLAGTEHRLAETRRLSEAPLPGKSLAVLDPGLGVITQLVPCEDAYTQERALVDEVLPTVKAGELWLADRNFCTLKILFGIAQQGGWSLIREHQQVPFKTLSALGKRVRIDGGWVREQRIEVSYQGHTLKLRRLCVDLDEPTRDGDDQIQLWSTLPRKTASAAQLAELYRKRWTIETAFLKMTVELRCEINTLGYPRAALFGFAVAVVAYNSLAVIWATLRVVHDEQTVDNDISSYHVADEMANMAESLTLIVDAEDWAVFRQVSVAVMASWLLACAANIQLRKYKKAKKRGPKKPPPKRTKSASPHVSTARLIAQRTSQ